MLDLKKMLTKISKQMKEEFIFQDYECPATSISAGGIGTYAVSTNINIAKNGYDIVSISNYLVGHGTSYNVKESYYNGKLYFNFYRTNTTAYSVPKGDVIARVLYKKVGGVLLKGSIFKAFSHRRKAVASC